MDWPFSQELKCHNLDRSNYALLHAIQNKENCKITTNIAKFKFTRKLAVFCAANNIKITFKKNIPTTPFPGNNRDKMCWKLNPVFLESFCKNFETDVPTFDCYASCRNKQTPEYCCKDSDLISPYWDFTSFDENFPIPLHHIFHANPPFIRWIMERTLEIFVKFNLKGYIITPKRIQDEDLNIRIANTATKTIHIDPHRTFSFLVQPTTCVVLAPLSLLYKLKFLTYNQNN